MGYPVGVQLSTLTFSNPITFLGNDATRTEVSVQATAGVVWAATGQPIDDFAELVAPGSGMPGSLTVPFVDQAGFTDQAGNDFTMWAYVVTRTTYFGNASKTVKKNWQPLVGQGTVDFDNLPGGSIGLPVAVPPNPVSSIAGLTGMVAAESLLGALEPELSATIGDKVKGSDPYDSPWDIVLVAGQSNSWETDYPAFYNTEPDNNVLAWDTATGTAAVVPSKNDEIGFAFARQYAKDHLARGRKVIKTRNGYGETGFSSTSLTGQAGYTTVPNGTWDRALTADPLNRALEVISTANAVLAAAPAGSKIVAMIWSQGEQDRVKIASDGDAWYAGKLDDFFGWVRTTLALPQLPIIVMSQTPDTIEGSAGGQAINRVHEATPNRLKWTTYVYGPEGYAKTNENIHFTTPGHTLRGKMASAALPKAKLNNSVIRPGQPLNPRVQVLGTVAKVRWEPPVQRVTSYTLNYSTDHGATWVAVTLPHSMATAASITVPLNAPVWVRVLSNNEYGTPSAWTPVATAYGSTPVATPDPTAPPALTVNDFSNRWAAKTMPAGQVASFTPYFGSTPLVQATTTKQPSVIDSGGVKVLSFDGVDDDVAATVATAKTITVVAKVKAAVGVNTGIFSTGPNLVRRTNEATPRIGTQVNGGTNEFWPYTEDTKFHVFTLIADGTTGAISIDGGYQALNGATANTAVTLGRYGTTNFGNVDIIEAVTWNRALSSAECASVRNDLKAGYPTGTIF